MWRLVTATLVLPLVVVILDKSCQLLCLRVLVALERNQCSAISIDEIEESQGLFYRQIEGDTHFMFEDESGLLYAYLKTPDDCIHGIIPFQSALPCCGFCINPSEMISFAILLQSFVHLRRDVPDNRMKVLTWCFWTSGTRMYRSFLQPIILLHGYAPHIPASAFPEGNTAIG